MVRKVVIVDDEEAGRKLLREYLQGYPDFLVIGEASNGVNAVKVIEMLSPDLVFMDVQMPGMTGLEVIASLGPKTVRPNIIFSTAFDQYACEAFEINAVDYLLKPYTKARFDQALERVIQAGDDNIADIERLTRHLVQRIPKTILVQKGQRYVTILTEDIIWIGAEKDYSVIATAEGRFLSSYGIGLMEEKLQGGDFLRIHRSTIVNTRKIGEVFKFPSSYEVKMINGDKVRVSRSYLETFRKIIF